MKGAIYTSTQQADIADQESVEKGRTISQDGAAREMRNRTANGRPCGACVRAEQTIINAERGVPDDNKNLSPQTRAVVKMCRIQLIEWKNSQEFIGKS